MPSDRIPLSDLLASVRSEIVTADAAAQEAGVAVMKFDECEFEFAVEIEKDAKGGIKVWVLELGGGVKKKDSNKIRVKYKSTSTAYSAPSVVGDDGPEIKRQS